MSADAAALFAQSAKAKVDAIMVRTNAASSQLKTKGVGSER